MFYQSTKEVTVLSISKLGLFYTFSLGFVIGALVMVPSVIVYKKAVDNEYNTRLEAFAYDQALRNGLDEDEVMTELFEVKIEPKVKSPNEK